MIEVPTITAEVRDTSPRRIGVDTPYVYRDRIKSVPGARWDSKDKVWTVPLSWTACIALRNEFSAELVLGDELKKWAAPVGQSKSVLTEYRTCIEPPEHSAFDLPMDSPGMADLYPYQKVDAGLIALSERYLLMNGTGVGKTRSSLAGLRTLYDRGHDVFPALVAAPLSMLRTWEKEIKGFFPEATVSVVTGTPAKVRTALSPGSDFYVICWDSLRTNSRLAPFPTVAMTEKEKTEKELNALGLQTFIGDEIHRCRNPKAKRTRAAWFLAHRCRYVIGLTGTPMQDTPEDLYGMLHLIAPEEYPTKTSMVERYLEYEWNMYGGRDIIGIREDREAEWRRNFDARTRRITKEMVLDFLPPKVEEVRWVSLPPKHRKAYTTLRDTYITELESSVMAVDNQLTLGTRLVQLANAMGDIVTTPGVDGGEGTTQFVMAEDKSPKVDAFINDYLEGDFEGEQIVVFSDSRGLIEVCASALAAKKIPFVAITGDVTGDERQAAMDAFQAGKIPVCLLTRAGGEGITLTAASTMVRLVRSWSLTIHQQVADRVHRIGSERHDVVRYVDYLVEDTIEESQMVRLNDKEARTGSVLRDGELLAMLRGST